MGRRSRIRRSRTVALCVALASSACGRSTDPSGQSTVGRGDGPSSLTSPRSQECLVVHHDLAHRIDASRLERAPTTNVEESLVARSGEYRIVLKIGDPAKEIPVVVDTGSADLVILGGPKICSNCRGDTWSPDSSAKDQQQLVAVEYGSGSAKARVYRAPVGLDCGVPRDPYSFAVVTEDTSTGAGLPNILGLAYGPVARIRGSTPFFDHLVEGGVADQFSMLLCGLGREGKMSFGGGVPGADGAALVWIPLVQERYYSVGAVSLREQGANTPMGSITRTGDADGTAMPTILDSGTTMILLPEPLVDRMRRRLAQVNQAKRLGFHDEVFDATEGGRNHISKAKLERLDALPTFEVLITGLDGSPQAFPISPRTYMKEIEPGRRVFAIRPIPSGVNNAVFGQAFMEGFYVVFDRVNRRIGLAPQGALCD